jgi:membrane protein YdbS with pleckstrin-like domain
VDASTAEIIVTVARAIVIIVGIMCAVFIVSALVDLALWKYRKDRQ